MQSLKPVRCVIDFFHDFLIVWRVRRSVKECQRGEGGSRGGRRRHSASCVLSESNQAFPGPDVALDCTCHAHMNTNDTEAHTPNACQERARPGCSMLRRLSKRAEPCMWALPHACSASLHSCSRGARGVGLQTDKWASKSSGNEYTLA